MPFRFIEDEATADVAVEAYDNDLSGVFRDSAIALNKTMIENPEDIRPQVDRKIFLEYNQLDLLLYNFLEQFIYFKDTGQLLLNTVDITVKKKQDNWELSARLSGEKLEPSRHRQLVDVKAVTLHQLSLHQVNNMWKAHFVLDI